MEVIIRATRDDAVNLTARIMAQEIRRTPDIVLGLATGRTMERVYARLASMHHEEGLDFAGVSTFNLDEYIGLPLDSPHSYHSYMDKYLFNLINIDKANTHVPNGMAADIDAECRDYEACIAAKGGIDLQILGIGETGHIGFNEPLSAMRSRTRPKALSPRTIEQNGPLFGDPKRMPRRAITMGVGTILDARRCVLLATGEGKADVIAKAVEGPVTSMISASALQLHPRCVVIVDEAAASQLSQKDYYYWIFDNEPEWQEFH